MISSTRVVISVALNLKMIMITTKILMMMTMIVVKIKMIMSTMVAILKMMNFFYFYWWLLGLFAPPGHTDTLFPVRALYPEPHTRP